MNQLIFETIQNLSKFTFVKSFVLFLSYGFPYIFSILLATWAFLGPRKFFNFSLIFITSSFTWLCSVLLKNIFQIARPILENPIVLETGYSFPSSHAAVSMAAATVVFYFDKVWGSVFIIASVLIGISRVVLGVHYPLAICL